MNELARLSGENRELRGRLKSTESFDGLDFEDLVQFMDARKLSEKELDNLPLATVKIQYERVRGGSGELSFLRCFEMGFDEMAAGFTLSQFPYVNSFVVTLVGFGLLRKEDQGLMLGLSRYEITEASRRLRNLLLSRRLRSGLGAAD
jgi:hypothetical protein